MLKFLLLNNGSVYLHKTYELSRFFENDPLLIAITPFFSPALIQRLKPKLLITLPESIRPLKDCHICPAMFFHFKAYITSKKLLLSTANLTRGKNLELSILFDRNQSIENALINSLYFPYPCKSNLLNPLLG